MTLPPSETAWRFVPPHETLPVVRAAASQCTACDLYKDATQTVFGEGAYDAGLMVVGEIPGDVEDRKGHPFVGPAGRILDQALAAADIDRDDVYVTNAVKHFKWRPVGKRRLHQKPSATEIEICRPWLVSEIELLRPRCIIAMGATAVRSLLGKTMAIADLRSRPIGSEWRIPVVVTYHPSAALRAGPDREARQRFIDSLVDDFRLAGRLLAG
jgi:DNA polymerase